MLGWFRADTLSGIRFDDFYWTQDGSLQVVIRKQKRRSGYDEHPRILLIPMDSATHPRSLLLIALRSHLTSSVWQRFLDDIEGSRSASRAASTISGNLRVLLSTNVRQVATSHAIRRSMVNLQQQRMVWRNWRLET